jgi:hypothetical protein
MWGKMWEVAMAVRPSDMESLEGEQVLRAG